MAGLYIFAVVLLTWLTLASAATAQVLTPAAPQAASPSPGDTPAGAGAPDPALIPAFTPALIPGSSPAESRSWLSTIKHNEWVSAINTTADGWTPRVDNITSGGGLAFGGAWRQPVLGGAARLTTDALFSVRGYHILEGELRATPFGDRRVAIAGRLRHDARPKDEFWGLGSESSASDHTSYSLTSLDASAAVSFTPVPWLNLETSAGYLNVQLGPGRQSGVPALEDRFTGAAAPGMTVPRAGFAHVGVSLEADRRDDALFTTSGSLYRASVTAYQGLRGMEGAFTRTDLEARQYVRVPGMPGHVLAFRALLACTGGQDDSTAPFYMLPRLGGRTLRGYDTQRFVGPHALAVSVEHRWQLHRKLQAVGFMDAGQVAPRLGDLAGSSGFKTSFGGGLRYRVKGAALMRLDVAAADGRTRVVVGFGPSF
jgi:hypothetical protein